MWHAAIALAAGTDSRDLGDQQLTKDGVPIVVDSCVAFVTQYGEPEPGPAGVPRVGAGGSTTKRFCGPPQVCARRGSTRGGATPSGRPGSWRSSPETLAT